ncbi:HAD-IA family hydrolase [Streptococcus penaeicida]
MAMNYDVYIWDLGGTLLDNYETSTKAFVETLAAYNLPGNHDQVYAKLKVSTEVAVATFAPFESNFLKDYKKREASALANPIWRHGAQEVLAKITKSGGQNFLISHRDEQVLHLLSQAHLLDYFTEIITSGNGFERKPNPESLFYLKEKYQIHKALVIGDRPIDRQAGQAAGFDTLLVDENKSLLEIVN